MGKGARKGRDFWDKESKYVRRLLLRRDRRRAKAAIRRGEDPPRNPKTQGWITW